VKNIDAPNFIERSPCVCPSGSVRRNAALRNLPWGPPLRGTFFAEADLVRVDLRTAPASAEERRRAMKIEGGCHCGSIRFEAEVDPATVVICHCTDCQTSSGSAFRTVVVTKPGTFALLSGAPTVYVKTAESGNRRQQPHLSTIPKQQKQPVLPEAAAGRDS
jgi:Glutathione-dependent formaldehyde-activating enzyme